MIYFLKQSLETQLQQ